MWLYFLYIKVNLYSKSLYISCAVSNFYGKEFEIWVGFGLVGSTEIQGSFYMLLCAFFKNIIVSALKCRIKWKWKHHNMILWNLNMYFELAIEAHLIVPCSTKGQTISKAFYGFLRESKTTITISRLLTYIPIS